MEEAKRKEALRIREDLEAFTARLHLYASTPEGQASIERSRDREYDAQWAAYRKTEAA